MSEVLLWSIAGVSVGAAAAVVIREVRRGSVAGDQDRAAAARLLGWEFQRLHHGFCVTGSHHGRNWEAVVSHDDMARWTTLTFGAPDIDRAQAIIVSRWQSCQGPDALQPQSIGSAAFARRFELWALNEQEGLRVLDAPLEKLLLEGPSSGLTSSMLGTTFRAWICPHGVRVSIDRPLTRWPQLQHFVQIGHTLGARGGLI
jgi:hypothetical protein